MASTSLQRLWLVIFLITGLFIPGARTVADSLDYGQLGSRIPSADSTLRVNRRQAVSIWSGEGSWYQFESGVIEGRTLWILADRRRLWGRRDSLPEPGSDDPIREIRGRIVAMDLHSLPSRRNRALLSVVHKYGDQMLSSVFAIHSRGPVLRLTPLHSDHLYAIRPVGDWMYRQGYDPRTLWKPTIRRLKTTREGYVPAHVLAFPDGTRLLSLTALGMNRWLLIDANGDLLLSERENVLARRSGNFGHTGILLEGTDADRPFDPVRLAPVYLPKYSLAVIVENPPKKSPLQGWLFPGGESSSLHLVRVNQNRLQTIEKVGPYDHPILDVEPAELNPDQFLILRRIAPERVQLEVLTLSSRSRTSISGMRGFDNGILGTGEGFDDLHNYKQSDRFSEKEKTMLEYVSRLSKSPAAVPDELYEKLENNFDEEQLVEITALASWENYRSRFNRGFDLQPQDFAAGSVCTVPAHSL